MTKWARGEIQPWRRTDFRPLRDPFPGTTQPTARPTRPPGTIVIHRQPELRDQLLVFDSQIIEHGDDWHIRPDSLAEQERILALLKLNRIHGILKTKGGRPT